MTKEKMGVQVMLDNNRQNLIESRTIKSDGVAGISGQLLTTINTVGSAALWHAQEAAKESMRNMSDFNDRIMSQEAINVATRLEDVNSDLVQRLERIAILKEVKDSTMSIVRDGTRELLNNLDKSAEMSEAFKRSQAEALGSTADVLGEHLTGEQENSKGQSGGATGGTGFSNLFGGPK
jgi:HD superfamily phosphohydrolase